LCLNKDDMALTWNSLRQIPSLLSRVQPRGHRTFPPSPLQNKETVAWNIKEFNVYCRWTIRGYVASLQLKPLFYLCKKFFLESFTCAKIEDDYQNQPFPAGFNHFPHCYNVAFTFFLLGRAWKSQCIAQCSSRCTHYSSLCTVVFFEGGNSSWEREWLIGNVAVPLA
jgi:hypothetical protein